MDGGFKDRDVPVADRFDLLRQALGAILSLGLKYTVAADALCLARTHKLDACFVGHACSNITTSWGAGRQQNFW